MFEVEGFPDEPLTGWTDDPNNYGYTYHVHTKDLVRLKNASKDFSLKIHHQK
jgi:alpha-glucosidase